MLVDDHLHQPPGFTFFDRAAYAGHRPTADEDVVAPSLRLRRCQAHAPERRVDVERVRRNAVGDSTSGTVEQVGCDDLKIVDEVCVKAPRPLQSPNAQTPEMLVPQLIIDQDVAAVVATDARGV